MTPLRKTSRTALAAFVVASLCVFVGCPSKPSADKSNASDPAAKQEDQGATNDTDSLVDTIVSMIDQSRDNPAVFVGVFEHMNQYLIARKDEFKPLTKEAMDRIDKIFGAGSSEEANRREFVREDQIYIRETMFLQEVVSSMPRGEMSEPAYAEKLLDFVSRYIYLKPIGSIEPAWPRETCIRGIGSVFERSWIFIELLRQAGIQGCIVGVPDKQKKDEIAAYLCGIIVGEEIYLYEPSYGIPIPSAKSGVATLKELQANPKLIEFLDADSKLPGYVLRPEDLKNFSVLLVMEPRMFAPRMKVLESNLAGKLRTYLTGDLEGMLVKAQTALDKIPNSAGVRVWKFPLTTTERLKSDGAAVRDMMVAGNFIWWRVEELVRTMQFRGHHAAAIERLVSLQQELTPSVIDEKLRAIGLRDSDRQKSISNTRFEIQYFIGLSKLDDASNPDAKKGAQVASDWFKRYYESENSAELTLSDVLNWSDFTRRMTAEASNAAVKVSPMKRLWELMSPEMRAAAGRVRDRAFQAMVAQREMQYLASIIMRMQQDAQEAGGVINIEQFMSALEEDVIKNMKGNAKDPPTIAFADTLLHMMENVKKEAKDHNAPIKEPDFRMQIQQQMGARQFNLEKLMREDSPDRLALVGEFNTLLKRPDMFRPADLSGSPQIEAMLQRAPKGGTPVEVLRFNRDILAAALPGEVASRRQLWLAGAIRNRATALKRMGNLPEAVNILKTSLSDMSPEEHARLLVLAKYWQKK